MDKAGFSYFGRTPVGSVQLASLGPISFRADLVASLCPLQTSTRIIPVFSSTTVPEMGHSTPPIYKAGFSHFGMLTGRTQFGPYHFGAFHDTPATSGLKLRRLTTWVPLIATRAKWRRRATLAVQAALRAIFSER